MMWRAIALSVVVFSALTLTGCTFAPTALGVLSLFAKNGEPAKAVWRVEAPEIAPAAPPTLPDLATAPQHAAAKR